MRYYHVKYIIIEPDLLDGRVVEALLDPTAVVRRTKGMVLLDADRWLAARAGRAANRVWSGGVNIAPNTLP
jgi:hypothetical protein